MKLIFDIDKEDIGALVVLLKPSPEEKQKIRDYIASYDEIEVPAEITKDGDNAEMMMAMAMIALGSIAHKIDK
ncbi:MAG: hypothetical protein IJP93_11140 [Bacteroidales bacterium]|nr:hypothetical protein [Bacteroidales bacterium]MBR0084626.1 hypothetical protein [Bacteroidales bacterium]MBR0292683.1 hypothetical protein [Bacteroidales bacterium]